VNVTGSNFNSNSATYGGGAIGISKKYYGKVICTKNSTIFKDNKPEDCNIEITWI
jgi:hypothetical protein